MHTITSFPAASVSRDQLGSILATYLALDRARIFRRLLVRRFGSLAVLMVILNGIWGLLTPLAQWMSVTIFTVPPVWAWLFELRLEWRLARRLDGVGGTATHDLPEAGAAIRKS